MSYVIKRVDDADGRYVAPLGSLHSYVYKLQDARTFLTRAEAERECCENERALSLNDAMGQARR